MTVIPFEKSIMHRVPTYEELVYDTITHPTDTIALPDRMATRLRNTQQLTRFDDNEASLDLGAEQENIAKQRAREAALHSLGGGGGGGGTASHARSESDASMRSAMSGPSSRGPPSDHPAFGPAMHPIHGHPAFGPSSHPAFGGTNYVYPHPHNSPGPSVPQSSSSSSSDTSMAVSAPSRSDGAAPWYQQQMLALEEKQMQDNVALMAMMRADTARRMAAAQQASAAAFSHDHTAVDQAMSQASTPSPTPQVAPAIPNTAMILAPETPYVQPYRPPPRAPRSRSANRGGPTPVIQPKSMPPTPPQRQAPATPVIPMRVNIGNGTPSPARTQSPIDGTHVPVPRYLSKSTARSKSSGREVVPGPLTSITESGRGRPAAKRARGGGVWSRSSERELVPTTTRAVSIASSSAKSSRPTSQLPQARSAASSSSKSRPRSIASSVSYHDPVAASSSAAAAPADRADVPTKLSKQRIPSKISNPQVLEELKRAKANGVLKGEGLAEYEDLERRRDLLKDSDITKISPSRYKEYKAIYKQYVYGKKPPEAS